MLGAFHWIGEFSSEVLGFFICFLLRLLFFYTVLNSAGVFGSKNGHVTINSHVGHTHGLQNVARGRLNVTVKFRRGDTSVHVTRCRDGAHAPGRRLLRGVTRMLGIGCHSLCRPALCTTRSMVCALFRLSRRCPNAQLCRIASAASPSLPRGRVTIDFHCHLLSSFLGR